MTEKNLPVPDLDVLRFQDLVDQAKRTLPSLAPSWTDHNVSDPGITLLEACAERVDQLSYRIGQLPSADREKLLALMAQAPEGTKTAQASPLAKTILTKVLEQ